MTDTNVCDHGVCNCTSAPTNTSVCQTISEMDWERGIWYAALTGDKDSVEKIINKSENARDAVNQPDNSGYVALHYAARSGHEEICKILLSYGAQVDVETKSGKATPLHRAATTGRVNIVKLLLSHGAEVMKQDADGETTLHKAAKNNHIKLVQYLLETYPELKHICNNKGNFPVTN